MLALFWSWERFPFFCFELKLGVWLLSDWMQNAIFLFDGETMEKLDLENLKLCGNEIIPIVYKQIIGFPWNHFSFLLAE